MSRVKEIRALLGVTQAELAVGIECAQGNVSHYENGQVLLPDRAMKLIEYAASRNLTLTLDQIYGREPLPEPKADTAA